MTAGANRSTAAPVRERRPEITLETERPYAFTVSVRTRLGDDLEGLEAHGDGISFRSPRPLEGGQLIELTICRAILVEAEVVGCATLADRDQGYWVRARFHHTSPAFAELICTELKRLMNMAE